MPHQFRALDFGAGGDDFGFSDTLALGGHGERVLQFVAEDDVLDEHGLDLDTPAGGHVFNDLADGLRKLFAALDNVLEDASTDDVAEGGLSSLDQSLADVGDAKGGLVGRCNVVVDDGCEVQSDVVLGHANLFWDLCYIVSDLM